MVQENKTLNFEQLHIFSQVVHQGGITAAANALGLAKSTVSMHITRLEKKMGVKLLERSSRRVVLTKEGAALLPRITSLLAEAEHLLEAAQSTKVNPRGDVRVAVTPALGELILPKFAQMLHQQHPEIRLIAEPTYDLADLQNPNYDFAIRVGHITDDNLIARKLGSFRRILIAEPNFAQQHKVNTPQDLKNMPCLIFNGSSTHIHWKFENGTKHQSVDIQAKFAARSFSILSTLAEQGFGYAYVTDFWAKEALNEGKLVRCLPNWHSEQIDVMLAYRVGAQKISRISAALKIAQQVTQELLAN